MHVCNAAKSILAQQLQKIDCKLVLDLYDSYYTDVMENTLRMNSIIIRL